MSLFVSSLKPAPLGKQSSGARNHAARADHSHSALGIEQVLFKKLEANFNVSTDQALDKSWDFGDYMITEIRVNNASVSLTTAAGGFYTGAGKTGVVAVANNQAYTALTGATLGMSATIAAAGKAVLTDDLILALTTPQGSAATADVYVIGIPLTEAA